MEGREAEVLGALASGNAGRAEELTRDLEQMPMASRARRRVELARIAALTLGKIDDWSERWCRFSPFWRQ